ncbi:MAG: hypothetical protein H0T59_04250 [Chloroflexi bacterium]|nr:hypothetical protein [Chloroflexota bacterium]
MRRLSTAILAALFAVGVLAPTAMAAPKGTSNGNAVPRVVFIVGPAGSATDNYRAEARAAAAIARRYTPDVVELYSPNATWPAVRQALEGASLVVYMGHGNGWPSRYRSELYPPTQNGFGLNPSAGGSDSIHQYFGEGPVGAQIKLARNAVVLLNHLCYASGNTEPGLPEGTIDQARQRVDNYAAGFIAAGASAVIAEAWSSPSYFVKAILAGGQSIQGAWLASPSANGNRFAFQSGRSPGYVAQMDPESRTSGFTRSIVMRTGLASRDVLAGAAGSASAATAGEAGPPILVEPTLVGTGLTLGEPGFGALPAAGTTGSVILPIKIKDRKRLPDGVQASVRWDPIDVTIAPVDPATEVTEAAPEDPTPEAEPAAASTTDAASSTGEGEPSAAPSADAESEPPVDPQTSPADEPRDIGSLGSPRTEIRESETRLDPPTEDIALVVPERLGDVVAPAAVKRTGKSWRVPVTLPAAAGRYRLTITLHDADGVVFDAATQALVASVIVRVTGEFDGEIQAAATADLVAGTHLNLGVRVVNLGQQAWGGKPRHVGSEVVHEAANKPATIVARWVPLSAGAELSAELAGATIEAVLPVGLKPGATIDATLAIVAPAAPGEYLLLLDVVTADHGSLVAAGAQPTLIRISVVAPAR